MLRRCLLLVGVLGSLACGGDSTEPKHDPTEPGDTAAARTGVERAIAGLGDAIGRSDAPAVAAYYTEDTYVHEWGSRRCETARPCSRSGSGFLRG